jgi:hypothetical protein
MIDSNEPTLLQRLRQHTEPQPEEIGRLIRAVRSGAAAPTQPLGGPWRWLLPVAVAASALLWWVRLPPPDVTLPRATLQAAAATLPEGLHLEASGEGSIEGSSLHPRLQWERGSIRVEVDPEAGLDVALRTREGEVRVIGTVFNVNRDALGTQVSVERGHVAVTCVSAAGPERSVTAGGTTTCLPTTAGGLLGRARALEDQGAAPLSVLEAIESGLALAEPGAAVSAELRYLRIDALHRAGRGPEARVEADRFLESGEKLRRVEVLRLAATLDLAEGGCPAAAARLTQLREAGAVADDPLLTRCAQP